MHEDEQQKQILISSKKLFTSNNYQSAKQKLQLLKNLSPSSQINLFILQHKINKDNTDIVLAALLKILTEENIKLYTQRYIAPNQLRQLRHVKHQYIYWNIIVIALKLGKSSVANLIANQASYFYGSFRTQTCLYILSHLVQTYLEEGRLSSCINMFSKCQKVLKQANIIQSKYNTICKIIFRKMLIQLKLFKNLEELAEKQSQQIIQPFKMRETKQLLKFNEGDAKYFPNFELIQYFLDAEVQFNNENYQASLQKLTQISINEQFIKIARSKIYTDNNAGIIYAKLGKQTLAKKYFISIWEKLKRSQTQIDDTQKLILYEKVKQNLLYSYVASKNSNFQEAYTQLKDHNFSYSYKFNYRKAEACLNYYHSYLKKNQRILSWDEIHDPYDTVYYDPNQPYFQQKGKNRNIYYPNKKHFYRRYTLHSKDIFYDESLVDKDIERKRFQKQAVTLKLKEILLQAQKYFKEALLIIQSEISIASSLEGFQGYLRQQFNETLFQEHLKFKLNITSILCYVELCLCQWEKCISFAIQLLQHKHFQRSEDYYNVLTYMMEAYCQIGNFQESYDIMNKICRMGVKQQKKITTRDSINLNAAAFQESDELNTFLFNIAVLHTRDNHIPQSYAAIQKLFAQMNILPNSNENLPLPMIDLLIHYNLRTQNYLSAIQMIKRKRILTMQGNTVRQLINVTK